MRQLLFRSTVLCLLFSLHAAAETIPLTPSKDNTLIQRTDPNAQLSNGTGDLFVGRTNQDGQGTATISIRRGLIQFDIAGSIPAGSIITGATLTMRDQMGQNGNRTTSLYRVLQEWGEGSSFFSGGQGAAPEDGDATWLYTFYDYANPSESPRWDTPGGDFDPTVVASTVINQGPSGQVFSWSSLGLVADVQFFLDNPDLNFGWILIGEESEGQTAKRLNSRETNTPPILTISYVVPEPSSVVLAVVALACVAGLRHRRRTQV